MAEYAASSDHPVPRPVLTQVLAQLIAAESEEAGAREKAFPSTCRYSDAGKCARAIGLESILPRPPITDVAGEFRMWIGTLLHEHVQAAIVAAYGGQVECATSLGTAHCGCSNRLASGHADWCGIVAGTDLGRICYELKTEGAYGFDKAIGINRKRYDRSYPHGPRSSAKLQGAINAVANDCDTLIIGVLVMDAISVQLAEKVGLGNLDRICAEWHYKRSEFDQWAKLALDRFTYVDATLANGNLPAREAIGDEMETVVLNPEADRQPWQCAYCRVRDACVKLGPFATVVQAQEMSC